MFGHDPKCQEPGNVSADDVAAAAAAAGGPPILAGHVHRGGKRHVDATPNYLRVGSPQDTWPTQLSKFICLPVLLCVVSYVSYL